MLYEIANIFTTRSKIVCYRLSRLEMNIKQMVRRRKKEKSIVNRRKVMNVTNVNLNGELKDDIL